AAGRAASSGGVSPQVALQPAAERREMKARAPRVEEHAAGRAHQHGRNDGWRVAVLAQDAADARPVARTDRREVVLLAWMLNDEGRVVLDARAAVERADQVVDLFARRRRQPEPFVERSHMLDDFAAQEDREGDRAVPEVVAGEHGCSARPPGL